MHAQATRVDVLAMGEAAGASAGLPEAPDPHSTATLSGTVLDGGGHMVPGTTVAVRGQNSGVVRTVKVDSAGAFTFAGLPADSYTVTVMAPGMEPVHPELLTMGEGAATSLPIVVTPIPKFTATVHVTADTTQIATEQVHLAEKQRVLGVVPNFYTSYDWNAAPMTPKLKLQLSARSLIDPFTLMITAGLAGYEQWHNTYPGYGGGAEGYGKRFGAAYGDTAISRLLGDALLPGLFHQDPRYFWLGKGTTLQRGGYALKESILCRGDDGRQQVNYSHILGSFMAAGLSNVYHSPEDRSAGITVRDGFVILGSEALDNVLREFLTRRLTSHVPPTANGKP